MDRGLAWVCAASVAGLCIMAGVSLVTDPPRVRLGDLGRHVGATVTTTARILELDVHDTGWTRMLLADGNHSVDATASAEPRATPGDVVDATGIVLRSGARLRLQIEHPDDVTVRVPWQDRNEPLRRLLERPWEHRDAAVVTSGEYRRFGASHFLEDEHHRLRLYGPGLAAMEPGMFLRVEGRLEYDGETGSFGLRVDQARRA